MGEGGIVDGTTHFLSKVSKLQSDGAAQPARFEENFAGGMQNCGNFGELICLWPDAEVWTCSP